MSTSKTAVRFPFVLAICTFLFSITFGIATVCRADSPVPFTENDIRLIEQCEAVFDGSTLIVTDTDDNPDVWSSKLLIDAGMDLTPGEQYTVSFSLAGENGVGEFFLCKGENIDERYDETFAAEKGDRSITFTAARSRVYIGMQVGNLGKGRSVTATVTNLSKQSESANPALLRTENCSVSVGDGVITATDSSDNNDVWNSKLLYHTGIQLKAGKTYKLTFSLDGSHGVGEFFVCKSPNLNDRYDATFVNQAGSHSVTFTAMSDVLYIGMQLGNLGPGNSVILTVNELKEVRKNGGSSPKKTPVLLAQNCTYDVQGAGSKTTVTATDTSDESEVWTSRLLLDLGEILEERKIYAANFNLAFDSGFAEFFFLKTADENMDKRYSFNDTPGDHTAQFQAEASQLYAGLQFGSVGVGNDARVTIEDIFQIPALWKSSENCEMSLSLDTITLTDTDDNPDPWNSKAIFDSCAVLEPGKEYTATFTLAGDHGVGEFLILKSTNTNERYFFFDTPGTHTVTFTATGNTLFFAAQCGSIGNGNSMSISGITVTPVEAEDTVGKDALGAAPAGGDETESKAEAADEPEAAEPLAAEPEAADEAAPEAAPAEGAQGEEEPASIADSADEPDETETPADEPEAADKAVLEAVPAEGAKGEEEPASIADSADESDETETQADEPEAADEAAPEAAPAEGAKGEEEPAAIADSADEPDEAEAPADASEESAVPAREEPNTEAVTENADE